MWAARTAVSSLLQSLQQLRAPRSSAAMVFALAISTIALALSVSATAAKGFKCPDGNVTSNEAVCALSMCSDAAADSPPTVLCVLLAPRRPSAEPLR